MQSKDETPFRQYNVVWKDGRPMIYSVEVLSIEDGWWIFRAIRDDRVKTWKEKRPDVLSDSPAEAWHEAITCMAQRWKVCATYDPKGQQAFRDFCTLIKSALAHAYWSGGGDGKRQAGAEYLGAYFEEVPEAIELQQLEDEAE